jgi:flagellar basal-body rod protein FlgB
MAISIDKVMQYHETALLLRSKRSEVLASNIANANTPGYKARDFDFSKALQAAQSQQTSGLSRTHPMHFSGTGASGGVDMQYVVPVQTGTGDGNTVDLPSQQMAFAQNALEYQMSMRFLDSKIKGMMTALKGE